MFEIAFKSVLIGAMNGLIVYLALRYAIPLKKSQHDASLVFLKQAEEHARQLMGSEMIAYYPGSCHWLCVLPNGTIAFRDTMEEAEDFAFEQGYSHGEFVIEYVTGEEPKELVPGYICEKSNEWVPLDGKNSKVKSANHD